jgi:hypothetical protein
MKKTQYHLFNHCNIEISFRIHFQLKASNILVIKTPHGSFTLIYVAGGIERFVTSQPFSPKI